LVIKITLHYSTRNTYTATYLLKSALWKHCCHEKCFRCWVGA